MTKYKILAFLVLLSLFTFNIQAQDFSELVKNAQKLYQDKEYLSSAKIYDKAFEQKEGKAKDYYNAACSWALAKDKEKSLKYLNLALDKGWHNKKWLANDKDLEILHQEKEWTKLLSKAQKNLQEYEKDFDKPLQKKLEKIYVKDQTLRQLYRDAETKFGSNSDEMKYFWSLMAEEDKENEQEIIKILDEKGWPGKSLVGGKANIAVFLVIQHAPLKIQEKYLPMFEESVKKGESQSKNFALLQDRILMRKGKAQLYGSQVKRGKNGKYEFHKIKEPEYINQRRKEIGLSPIEEYAKRYDIVWDIEQKKK